MKSSRKPLNFHSPLSYLFLAVLVTGAIAFILTVKELQVARLDNRSDATDAIFTTKSISQYPAASTFLNWQDWYPVNFNQPENHRMVNRWPNKAFFSLNVPNKVSTLPTTYLGKPIDYFYFYQCYNYDLKCYSHSGALYNEIISQGDTTLEHWARGNSAGWEVYYHSSKLPPDKCTGSWLTQNNFNYADPANKAPVVMKLPATPGTIYVNEPVCMGVFKNYVQSNANLVDSRIRPEYARLFETGTMLVITINHQQFKDTEGHDIIYAENIYYSDNTTATSRFDSYCSQNPDDQLHCALVNGKRTGRTFIKNNISFKPFLSESYWMRKTKQTGKYPGIVDRYGMGKYQQNRSEITVDKINNTAVFYPGLGTENQEWTMEKCTLNGWYNATSCTTVSPAR